MNTVVLVLAFAILTVLAWRFWKPRPKREIPVGKARLYFFYTDWCGWSQKAMPEWEKLESALESTPYFGTTNVVPVRVNAEEDRPTAQLYEVDSYPRILLETSDSLREFKGKRTAEDLLEFLRESFGKEVASL
jgi:thiol-disulfide isomerase/thioredoxin